ncbi:hypothetical protein J437_LFUL000817 [Ladona fulva]|uniref:Neuroglian n=1 Tax=Ladona fulva TaxID=123851 RepID=A0A8K0KT13_LADFU|nr:hypothetical protein J437_LFUL000817 [Ladona fulva]
MESFVRFAVLITALGVCTHALIQSPPRIVKQPPTDEVLFQVAVQQIENDKPFIIECEAEGEPAPKTRKVSADRRIEEIRMNSM